MDEMKKCLGCGLEFPMDKLFPAELLRSTVAEEGKRLFPHWDDHGFLCMEDLRKIRASRITKILVEDRGELSSLEKEVIESLKDHDLIAENINQQFEERLTFGQRISDKIAKFGGSWAFIISFIMAMIFWMTLNVIGLWKQPFDPYPFILLNLVLSCLAALQAPIIMMSQNRQAMKDRMQADDDYRVNLKAELEIRHIHAKLDQFTKNQWSRMLEIQQIQIDLQEELLKHNHLVDDHIKENGTE